MNIHAALLMIDFVCEHRFSEPRCDDQTRKELLFAISELADSCVEAIEALNDPVEWYHCLSEVKLVREFVEEASKTGNHEYAFLHVQGVSLRATPSPGETESHH
jgi:hypothetical protein